VSTFFRTTFLSFTQKEPPRSFCNRQNTAPVALKTFIKIVMACCLLLAGFQNANATKITIASVVPPNTAATLYQGQTGIVIYGLSATTNNVAGTSAVSGFTFTGSQTITNNFSLANIALYYTTSATLTGGTNLGATVAATGTTLTFTGFSQTVVQNSVGYFYVVVNFDTALGTVPGTFELDEATITDNSTNTTTNTVTGTAYNLVGSEATLTSLTTTAGNNGLAATPVVDGSANYSVYGFSLTGAGTGTGAINSLEFFDGGGTASKDNSYYTTAYLYSSTSSTYVPGTTNVAANLVSTATSDNTRYINFTGTNISVTGTTNLYYFIVLSNTLANTTASLFALNYYANTVTNTVLNTGTSVTGPSYTFGGPPTFGTATTTGLATAASLDYTQTQAGILGFSITTTAATTVNSISFSAAMTPASTIGTFFSNVNLYVNSTNSLTGATPVMGATVSALTGTTFTISGLSQVINSTTLYYFIEADYTQPASGSTTFQLSATSQTTTTSATAYTTGGPIAGISYTLTLPVLTATDLTGASLTGTTLVQGQTNIAVAGVSFATNVSTTTLSQMVFRFNPGLATANNYFVAPILVTCPTSTYSAAAATVVPTVGNTFAGLVCTMNISPATTVSTTPAYYFLVINYSVAGGTTPQAFNITPTAYTTGLGTVTTGYTAATYTCYAPPTIAYTGSPYTYTVGTAITSLTPATTNTPVSYAISPNITTNTGLAFSTTTGVISGTPATASTAVTYTITATNPGGAGNTMITVTVYPISPTVTYTGSPYIFTVGTAITSQTPATTNTPTSFSISPSLNTNTGLTFNTTTGVISGTPTTASAAVTYTITASNANPITGSTMISITVYPVSPTVAYTGSPYTFTVGTAITAQTPATTGIPTSFTISPSLNTNTGLTFNTATGVISGTPTTASAAVTYTISAFNVNPTAGTTTVNITVYPVSPTVAYTGSPYTFTVGTAITSQTPTTTGTPASFSISPSLNTNTGLTFNTTTGVISGTPTTASTAVTYTISAFNANPTAGTTTVSITVYPISPTVAYTGSPYIFTVGTAITSQTPTTTNSPTSFTISPSLNTNTGLTFNTTTGVISGTPSTASAAVTYTITASNANPTAGNTTVSIACYPLPTIAYTGSPYTYTVGTAITSLTPTTTNTPTSYSISPNITSNTGLAFSTTTGIISGTPTIVSTAVTYTVTATNPGGSGATMISVTVYPKIPTVAYTGSPYIFTVGTAITTLTPATTNAPTSFSISPSLNTNTGLTFNTTTGVISGTPATASTAVTYTITASNANPTTGTTTISVTVYPPAPTIAYTGSPFFYTVGTAITSLTPTTTNSPTTYAITPNITTRTGLTFSTTTGVISGTPTINTGAVTYTITASNANPTTGTTTISIRVYPAAPTIAYTGTPYTFAVGTAITSQTPTTTGTPTSFTISPSLNTNTGLTFSTTTGVISGTPITASAAVTYTITASNANPTAGSTTISVTCIQAPAISYTPASYNLVGTAMTLSPANTGGAVASFAYGAAINTYSTGATRPWGMAFDAAGNLYVADYTNGIVYKYNVATGVAASFITGLTKPTGIVFDASGNVYVSQFNGNVYSFASSGGSQTLLVTGGAGTATNPKSAYGLAIDASANLYIADYSGGNIYKYTAATATTAIIVANGTTDLSEPAGVAVDAAGNIYAVDNTSNVLAKYSAAGAYISTVATGFGNPFGLYIDNSGNFYVGDPGAGDVSVYNSSGTLLTTVTGFGGPRGIAVDSKGDLFVSDFANEAITEYPPVGGYILAYASGTTSLPPGLSFNTTTGIISGTPTAQFTGSYTITGYNFAGSSTCSPFTINCVLAPTITYTGSPFVYTVGAAITPLTPALTGAPTSIAISPNLTTNTGLSFNTTTGVISGTPTNSSSATTYTIIATNPYSTGSTTISIAVVAAATISYTPSTNNYTAGTTITPLVPTSTNVAGQSFGAGAALTGGTLNEPDAEAFDASGNLWVAYYGSGTVAEYNASGAYVTSFTPTGGSPSGIVFDSSGNMYVLSEATGFIYKYNTSLTKTATLRPGGGIVAGYGLAIDAVGNLYAASYTNNNITKFTSSGIKIANFTNSLNEPESIAVDNSGDIFVLNYGNKNIVELSAKGSYLTAITSLSNPKEITVDASGNIYVSDWGTGKVTEYNPNGTVVASVSGLTAPEAIAVNSSGDVFVSDYTNNTVTEYPPFGGYSLSGALPAGLSFSSATGTFSGTPTVSWPSTIYTVTCYNGVGTPATATVTISCTVSPFAFNYSPATNVYPVNVAINPLIPTITSGVVAPLSFGAGTGITGGTLSEPQNINFDPSGNMYVTNYGNGTVTEYSSAGVFIADIALMPPSHPDDVVFDSSGDAFVVGNGGNIYKYTGGFGGTKSTWLTGLANTDQVTLSLAMDASNNIYVVSSSSATTGNSVREFASTGTTVGAAKLTITSNLSYPSGIAVDASGNIYVSNIGNNTVYEYSATNTTGTQVLSSVTLSLPYTIAVDAAGNLYIANFTSNTVDVVNPQVAINTLVTSFNAPNPDGVAIDSQGNVYVSDYADNSVVEYPPYSGFSVAGTLPPGLSFNQNTGTFSGTPTAAWPVTTYTVTGYSYGTTGTTNVTISCIFSYDWIGTTSSDWNTATNWESLAVPGAANTANIGVNYAFTNQPNVGSTGTNSVAAVQIGNSGGQAVTLTVTSPYTLAVTGDITKQSDANSTLGYAATVAGTGIIQATNLNVIASSAATSAYTETLASSITSLQLSGNIALTANYSGTAENAQFSLTGGVTTLTTAGLLKTTNTTGGTSTFYLNTGSSTITGTLQAANATFLSGLSAAGTNAVTLGAGSIIEYSGAAQTVYTDAAIANLSGGVGLSYNGIKFSGTGIKTPTSGNLNVAGSFTNAMANDAADYVLLTGTPVFFNSATTQGLAGGSGNGTVFKSVTFNGGGAATMASGLFYVNSTGTLTMVNGASTGTSLNAGGFLTLNSDVNGCASVPQIPAGSSITGTVNVQRYISGERGYRLLSSPVYAGAQNGNYIYSINYLSNSLYLTGSGSGFTATGNPTLYLYDEGFVPQYATFYDSNFIAISSLSGGTGTDPAYSVNVNLASLAGVYNIPVGNGYYCFYRGNLASETTAELTTPTYTPAPTTITASGTLNQGQITFADWYTPTSTNLGGISQNYNLVGNPYPSAIDLGAIQGTLTNSGIYITPFSSGTGISKFIYELNPVSGSYGIYTYDGSAPATNGATEFIASGQGFFVQAYGAASKLIFNENAKATATNADAEGLMAKRLANFNPVRINPLLRLKLAADSIHTEETIIAFRPDAKSEYTFNEDAPHRAGVGKVGISSMSSDNVKLAINARPLTGNMTIPLNVNATVSGLYNINLKQDSPLPSIYEVWLMDAYKKDSLQINYNPVYNFDINISDTTTYGSNRFSLVIRENPALMVHLLSFNATKAIAGVNVVWTTENEQNYTNFTVERSTDGGTTFTNLGAITSSAVGAYTYLDKNPAGGANMYRLMIVDLTGAVSYSNIVTIMYTNTSNQLALNGMTVYPNPTANMVNLSITQTTSTTVAESLASASYKIEIVNNLGVVVRNAVSSSPTWTSDVTSLSPGTYFISVVNASNNSVVGKSAFVKL
jgi:sugar lactone lactonase YvrE